MKVRDIVAAVEEFAPLGLQEKWDNSGLCVGSPDQEVHGVLLGLDCTPALVDEAVAAGADLILTHHPLIFGSLKSVRPEDPVGLALIKAIRAGIAVYASHTPSDKVLAGVSGAMARRLGLTQIRVLEPEGDGETGLGAIGVWPEPLSADEALRRVKEAFGLQVVRASRPVAEPVRTVAMCGGSGSSLIGTARAAGAQLYISGDVSYHHFFVPDGFMILDIGHFESEKEIVYILYSLIRKKFPTFAIQCTAALDSANPIHYL